MKHLLYWAFLLQIACSPQEKPQEAPKPPIPAVSPVAQEAVSEEQQLFVRLDSFAHRFKYNSQIRVWIPGEKTPKYAWKIELFEQMGPEKVFFYPYPVSSWTHEPFLLIFEFKDTVGAINAYDKAYQISQLDLSEHRAEAFDFKASIKPGNMLYQRGKYLFLLEKCCQDTPIGGRWPGYEMLFLKHVAKKGEHIEVLNADCGDMEYKKEKKVVE